jgi:hypothetical protein
MATPQNLEIDGPGSDFLVLLRDLGHLDEPALEVLTGQLVARAHNGQVVTLAEVREAAATLLFEREAGLRADARDVLTAEWGRMFY